MTLRRCHSCRAFYDKKLPECDQCGTEGYPFNKHSRAASLNNHLYGMAEKAEGEKRYAEARGL